MAWFIFHGLNWSLGDWLFTKLAPLQWKRMAEINQEKNWWISPKKNLPSEWQVLV
jgi:hypothetical protein